ncbi:uncharacterized protein LOC143079833 [Mytilus galloprovincialis]|uniref:uncharacterized protein LOC143079833 n=1 Tax=Mytilus galloprovincialis TaxID=29158 RepID=UPI003F7C7D5D
MVEVVTGIRRCREIVRQLEKYNTTISVDAEGINLGKDGPLTLLQIGTIDKHVFLFDVWTNKNLFQKGKLKDILESEKIIKVMHSCRGDSAALYFQFEVLLENVFDTQVAHLVMEEHKGRKLPRCIKLSDACKQYSENAEVSEEKDDIKKVFAKEDGCFWANRPLTQEMIDYASGDVTALIPEVYETQKKYLEENDLLDTFQDRVYEEITCAHDKKQSTKRYKRQHKVVKGIMKEIPNKYPSDVKFEDITDEDDITAIRKTKFNTKNLHPMLKRLNTEAIKNQLQHLDLQLADEENSFTPKSRSYAFLRTYQNHTDEDIQTEAKRILDKINKNILEIMLQKYDPKTSPDMLALNEKEALNALRPRGVRDRQINPLLLKFYWQMKEENLDSTIHVFREKDSDYTIPENFYKWLKFCCSGNVPEEMKSKARRLMRNLDRTFGKGVVPGRQCTSD